MHIIVSFQKANLSRYQIRGLKYWVLWSGTVLTFKVIRTKGVNVDLSFHQSRSSSVNALVTTVKQQQQNATENIFDCIKCKNSQETKRHKTFALILTESAYYVWCNAFIFKHEFVNFRALQVFNMALQQSSVHAKWVIGRVIGTKMRKTAKVRVTRLVLDPYLLKVHKSTGQ